MNTAYLSPSVFWQAKKQDGLKSNNHSPLAQPLELVAHLHKIAMKQMPVCSGCDWLISKSTMKDRFVTDRLNTSASQLCRIALRLSSRGGAGGKVAGFRLILKGLGCYETILRIHLNLGGPHELHPWSVDSLVSDYFRTLRVHCIPLGWSRSGSVIQDHLDQGASNELLNPWPEWIQQHSDHGASKELLNPCPEWIHWFLWCRSMIRVILDHWSWSGSSQRSTPLSLHNS